MRRHLSPLYAENTECEAGLLARLGEHCAKTKLRSWVIKGMDQNDKPPFVRREGTEEEVVPFRHCTLPNGLAETTERQLRLHASTLVPCTIQRWFPQAIHSSSIVRHPLQDRDRKTVHTMKARQLRSSLIATRGQQSPDLQPDLVFDAAAAFLLCEFWAVQERRVTAVGR